MKRLLFFALILMPFMVSCEKDDEDLVNGKWYEDYEYYLDEPENITYFTHGEYIIIDGNTITLHDGDLLDGVPLDFSYKDGKVTMAGSHVFKVNKLTKKTMEWQDDVQKLVIGYKKK